MRCKHFLETSFSHYTIFHGHNVFDKGRLLQSRFRHDLCSTRLHLSKTLSKLCEWVYCRNRKFYEMEDFTIVSNTSVSGKWLMICSTKGVRTRMFRLIMLTLF